jgi:hypothetical protein
MGFGGEPRKAGYGKYDGTRMVADEHSLGVPGAFGNPEFNQDGDQDMPKGDEVNKEMGIVEPTRDAPGVRAALHVGKKHKPS